LVIQIQAQFLISQQNGWVVVPCIPRWKFDKSAFLTCIFFTF
jgi:hypothetical protein